MTPELKTIVQTLPEKERGLVEFLAALHTAKGERLTAEGVIAALATIAVENNTTVSTLAEALRELQTLMNHCAQTTAAITTKTLQPFEFAL